MLHVLSNVLHVYKTALQSNGIKSKKMCCHNYNGLKVMNSLNSIRDGDNDPDC